MSGMMNVARTLQYRKKLTCTALSTNTPHVSVCVFTPVSAFLAVRVNWTILNDLNKWGYLFEVKDIYNSFSKIIVYMYFQIVGMRYS